VGYIRNNVLGNFWRLYYRLQCVCQCCRQKQWKQI